MRVCVVSLKECWQDESGTWMSSGGFPMQMEAITSLFEESTLVVLSGAPNGRGMPLPRGARVVALRRPAGEDARRKLSVMARLPYYMGVITRHAASADVVHVPPPGDIPFLGMLVALALRKRLLVRYCGSWEVTTQTTLMNRVTRGVMRGFAGGRNVMLATGVEGGSPPGRGLRWVFATAISTEEIAAVRAELDRPPREPLALTYAGRLSPEKGVEHVIRALAIMRDRGAVPGVTLPRLVVIGAGIERDALVALTRALDCEHSVSFVGQRDRQGVLAELLRSDVCVLPSLSESFCKVRLEAMLCGTAVLTTPVGFGREIVGGDGERGWVVPAADPAAIAETLWRVAEGPRDWPALRRRCRAYAEGFTLERWKDEIGEACASQWGMSLVEGKLAS